jgi:anti-sigma regulatory factor (Ser/Thr protein kinase)
MAVRSFRCQPQSVTDARLFVRDALGDQPREVMDVAELITSELTANCVRHAGTDFELAIDSGGQIRIEVRDRSSRVPRLLSPASHELAGRGLQIVDALADDWGVAAVDGGKTVWFTLRVGRSG